MASRTKNRQDLAKDNPRSNPTRYKASKYKDPTILRIQDRNGPSSPTPSARSHPPPPNRRSPRLQRSTTEGAPTSEFQQASIRPITSNIPTIPFNFQQQRPPSSGPQSPRPAISASKTQQSPGELLSHSKRRFSTDFGSPRAAPQSQGGGPSVPPLLSSTPASPRTPSGGLSTPGGDGIRLFSRAIRGCNLTPKSDSPSVPSPNVTSPTGTSHSPLVPRGTSSPHQHVGASQAQGGAIQPPADASSRGTSKPTSRPVTADQSASARNQRPPIPSGGPSKRSQLSSAPQARFARPRGAPKTGTSISSSPAPLSMSRAIPTGTIPLNQPPEPSNTPNITQGSSPAPGGVIYPSATLSVGGTPAVTPRRARANPFVLTDIPDPPLSTSSFTEPSPSPYQIGRAHV